MLIEIAFFKWWRMDAEGVGDTSLQLPARPWSNLPVDNQAWTDLWYTLVARRSYAESTLVNQWSPTLVFRTGTRRVPENHPARPKLPVRIAVRSGNSPVRPQVVQLKSRRDPQITECIATGSSVGLRAHPRPSEREVAHLNRVAFPIHSSVETAYNPPLHLWELHHLPVEARKGLNAFVQSLRLANPGTLAVRTDGSHPHPHLLLATGAACQLCDFRSTSRDLIARHMSKAHGRKSNQKTWLRDEIRDGVSLQSWVQSGQRKYWIVEAAEAPPIADIAQSNDSATTALRSAWVASLRRDEEQRWSSLQSRRQNDDAAGEDPVDDSARITNWMRRTGWLTTFERADRDLLMMLRQPPSAEGHPFCLRHSADSELLTSSVDDERRLRSIGGAIDRFLDRVEDTVRHTDQSIRCWLRSQVAGRPFKAPFRPDAATACVEEPIVRFQPQTGRSVPSHGKGSRACSEGGERG
ncbi:hypothetical protein MRB53_038466 [Persea americana]|nr:hypothetical protein MRB53_038466 [Persea americana]